MNYYFFGTASHKEHKCLFHSSSKFSTVIIFVQIQYHNLVLLIKSIEGSFRSSSRKDKNCRQILPDLRRQGQEVTENDLFILCYCSVCYNNNYYHHCYCYYSKLANYAGTSPGGDWERVGAILFIHPLFVMIRIIIIIIIIVQIWPI